MGRRFRRDEEVGALRICLSRQTVYFALSFSALLFGDGSVSLAADSDTPVTLDNVVPTEPNRPDEPFAPKFSAVKAIRFLDNAAIGWQKSNSCIACHTGYPYLMSLLLVSAEFHATSVIRDHAENIITERWRDKGPRWDAEVVMTAASLAANDAATTGKLHPLTKLSKECGPNNAMMAGLPGIRSAIGPPFEDDDYYGATVAALGTGMAPEEYSKTPSAQAGLAKLRTYFSANKAPCFTTKPWSSGQPLIFRT